MTVPGGLAVLSKTISPQMPALNGWHSKFEQKMIQKTLPWICEGHGYDAAFHSLLNCTQ